MVVGIIFFASFKNLNVHGETTNINGKMELDDNFFLNHKL